MGQSLQLQKNRRSSGPIGGWGSKTVPVSSSFNKRRPLGCFWPGLLQKSVILTKFSVDSRKKGSLCLVKVKEKAWTAAVWFCLNKEQRCWLQEAQEDCCWWLLCLLARLLQTKKGKREARTRKEPYLTTLRVIRKVICSICGFKYGNEENSREKQVVSFIFNCCSALVKVLLRILNVEASLIWFQPKLILQTRNVWMVMIRYPHLSLEPAAGDGVVPTKVKTLKKILYH